MCLLCVGFNGVKVHFGHASNVIEGDPIQKPRRWGRSMMLYLATNT